MMYHMRRQDRMINDPEELRSVLKNGKYTVIAMCRDNEPYIVTLSYGYDEQQNSLYFHAALTGLKMDFIAANPEVCATVIQDGGYLKDQCAHQYSSVVIRGQLYVVQELKDKQHGLQVLLNHLEENPGPILARNITDEAAYQRFAVLRLDIEEITGKKGS